MIALVIFRGGGGHTCGIVLLVHFNSDGLGFLESCCKALASVNYITIAKYLLVKALVIETISKTKQLFKL